MPKRQDGKPRRPPDAAHPWTPVRARSGRPSPSGRPVRQGPAAGKRRAPPGPDRSGGRAADAGRSPKEILEEIRRVAKPGAAPAAAKAFEEAVALLERGRDAAAVAPALEAKTLAPRSGAVREVLGLALYRTGRFGDALGELQAYRRITGRVDHNHLIADCYRAAGAPGKALPLVQEALRARIPEDARAEAAIVGASALADMGRTEAALSMLRAFPARSDSGRASDLRIWYVTGDVLARAGRTAEAVEEFRRVLRHDPGAFDTAERLAALGS